MASTPRQIVHLDLCAFFVSVERARNPALEGRALVIGGAPTSAGVVAALSDEARAQGVACGMPLREAALRCPQAVFLQGAFDQYREAADAVGAIIRRWTARLEWTSIDEAVLDLSGSPRPLGHARQMTEAIQRQIHDELSFDAAAGISTSRIVSAVASRLARPRGLLYVLPGYERRFLAGLDIELLPGMTAAAAARLRAAGVLTIGDLAVLDPLESQRLLGASARVHARHAAALDGSPVRPAIGRGPIGREDQISMLPFLVDQRGRRRAGGT